MTDESKQTNNKSIKDTRRDEWVRPRSIYGLTSIFQEMGYELRFNTRSRDIEIRPTNPGLLASDPTSLSHSEFVQYSLLYSFYQRFGVVSKAIPPYWVTLSQHIYIAIRDAIQSKYYYMTADKKLRKYKLNDQEFRDYLYSIASDNKADPVVDMLMNLPEWTGNKLIETIFIKYLGAKDDELTRELTAKFFVGAVARAFDPGCKHDWMPILVSDGQGIFKSTLLKSLVPHQYQDKWFTDNLDMAATTKEKMEITGGAWLIEFAELAGLVRAELEKAKRWLSATDDKARAAYARTAEEKPRDFVVCGTANDSGPGVLPYDSTGSRRFAVIHCHGTDMALPDMIREIEAILPQIWAEALVIYLDAEANHPISDQDELARARATNTPFQTAHLRQINRDACHTIFGDAEQKMQERNKDYEYKNRAIEDIVDVIMAVFFDPQSEWWKEQLGKGLKPDVGLTVTEMLAYVRQAKDAKHLLTDINHASSSLIAELKDRGELEQAKRKGVSPFTGVRGKQARVWRLPKS